MNEWMKNDSVFFVYAASLSSWSTSCDRFTFWTLNVSDPLEMDVYLNSQVCICLREACGSLETAKPTVQPLVLKLNYSMYYY